ncbi:MAG: SOS response-associated peptidase [Hyphomicrobiaceae bacterium]
MALRYALTSTSQDVQSHFDCEFVDDFPPREVISPKEPILMITRRNTTTKRQPRLVRWGLVPSWAKDFNSFGLLAFARLETIGEKAAFRGGIRHKRCLVPADDFSVVRAGPNGPEHRRARPVSRTLVALAAIYDEWLGADGSELETLALLTTRRNPNLTLPTTTTPLLVAKPNYESWLDCSRVDCEKALTLLRAPDQRDFFIVS